MIGDYPAAAALQRRLRGATTTTTTTTTAATNRRPRPVNPVEERRRRRRFRLSRIYTIVSVVLAVLAVVTTNKPQNSSATTTTTTFTTATATTTTTTPSTIAEVATNMNIHLNAHSYFKWNLFYYFQETPKEMPPPPPPVKSAPAWIRWALPNKKKSPNDNNNNNNNNNNNEDLSSAGGDCDSTESTCPSNDPTTIWGWLYACIDPAITNPHAASATDLIDKILTSTPRLLAISNLLVSMTYLLHTLVANWFLGVAPSSATAPQGDWSGRERLGGFLVFKLLLVSAVVAPDTFDLLILLTWYTLLSFLRSLAGLASATTAHTSQSGQPPRPGVLQLLSLVFVCNVLAAVVCVGLFSGAGWGMVLLLTCDCALLGTDLLGHLLRHGSQVLDQRHTAQVSSLEAQQLRLHSNNRNGSASASPEPSPPSSPVSPEPTRTALWDETDEAFMGRPTNRLEEEQEQEEEEATADNQTAAPEAEPMDEETILQLSRELDRLMEVLEAKHTNRLSVLETTVFALELLGYALTVVHFCHIWTLHGLHFTLIDGVLALHLHTAISAAAKKVSKISLVWACCHFVPNMYPHVCVHHFLDCRETESQQDCS